MTEHYKHLLLNVPVRHTLTMMKMDDAIIQNKTQLLKIKNSLALIFHSASYWRYCLG